MDIQNMSNRQLEELMQDISVELQERELRVNCEDAFNNHLSVGEISPEYIEAYVAYLEMCSDYPLAQELLSEWQSEQDIIQSRKTTGA